MSSVFKQYADLVSEWGKKMNLVSEPEPSAVMTHHVDDCVRAYECLKENFDPKKLSELPIVDIGSGAGFPGVVWAILSPNTKVCLIEPREKRATFLRHVTLKLQLKNVEVICSRFENLSREQLPPRCLFTSRALGYDADLKDTILKDVAANGSIWAVISGPESLEKLRSSVKRIVVEGGSFMNIEMTDGKYDLDKKLGYRAIFICYSNIKR